MKRTALILIAVLVTLGIVNSASAQPSVNQTVSISFPNKAALLISGDPGELTLTTLTLTPTGGVWTGTGDNTTKLYQVNNYGVSGQTLYITADANFGTTDMVAAGLTLQLTATQESGSTGMGSTIDLSDGTARNLISGIQRGFSGWGLNYQLSASESAQAVDLDGTVTFTVTATGAL